MDFNLAVDDDAENDDAPMPKLLVIRPAQKFERNDEGESEEAIMVRLMVDLGQDNRAASNGKCR